MNRTDVLHTITELSHEFGTTDYVRGGGGNTSCKTADTLWVKPSGTTLAGLQPETFVVMDRAALDKLFTLAIPAEASAREAQVKDVMAAAVKPGQTSRPSVEAPLHHVLHGTFVVHVHPALVNGLTCSQQGAQACAELMQVDRLDHVVIGSQIQAADAVGHAVAGGQHQHRRCVLAFAQGQQHVESVLERQAQIQNRSRVAA